MRYHGDPIAAVAADNVDTAKEALHLIEVEIDALPAPDRPQRGRREHHDPRGLGRVSGIPNLGRQGNVTSSGRVQWGDVQQGFAQADYVFEDRYDVAAWRIRRISSRALLWRTWSPLAHHRLTATQGIFPLRDSLAGIFGVPQTKIRVIPTEIGGGFGGKIAAVTEPAAMLLAQKSRSARQDHVQAR